MAATTSTTQAEKSTPKPMVVASAFLERYYLSLAQSPELVYRYYLENSKVRWPNSGGSSASSLDDIKSMILSSESKNCAVQIFSVDPQESSDNGVVALVTGVFTGKNNFRKKFTQMFFLVPQRKNSQNSHEMDRYFVLNDVLRYEGEEVVAVDGTASADPVIPDPEPELVIEEPKPDEDTTLVEEDKAEDTTQAKESMPSLENGTFSSDDTVTTTDHQVDATQNVEETAQNVEAVPAASSTQDGPPKKSYASVANALNLNQQPFQHRVITARPVTASSIHPAVLPRRPASPHPPSNNSVEKNNNVAAKGHSIFVANLPMDATEEQLKEAFEKFGPIKAGGIQVRSYMRERNCFGFVEFESATSMSSAVEAATIRIGGREAHIEEKKAQNGGSKYPRKNGGGYRNDNNYRGGYRNDNNYRGSNRNFNNGGTDKAYQNEDGGRNGISHHKVHQNGGAGRERDGGQPH